MEKNYSLVNWPRSTISLIWGQECEDITATIIPDVYKFGASGLCRVTDGKTKCKSQFPPTLNLAQAVLQDLDDAEATETSSDSATLQRCRESIDKPVNHKTAKKLGIVMISFIIASVFINIISLFVAAASGSAFSLPSTAVLAVDALFIFTSLVLCIAMMNFEGGGYLKEVHGQEFSDREMIGIAIWMLLAMLIGRILSNFWLIIGAICILLPIALVFVLFLVRTRGFFAVVRAAAADGE
ncbi:nadh oxidase [Fusarium heterosporum]|uniref:Nadh oxidase n=1 Tax=Fusarium heterosporum TaxID=42747 RepID=A0A8H5TP89_FUSHE|nr:nadh oxidase [Fusarium heterosporum]